MSSKFQKYALLGEQAIDLHPDHQAEDIFTLAKDMIGNILHAVEASLTPDDIAAGGEFSPEGVLEGALLGYYGDFEDAIPGEDVPVEVLRGKAAAYGDLLARSLTGRTQ